VYLVSDREGLASSSGSKGRIPSTLRLSFGNERSSQMERVGMLQCRGPTQVEEVVETSEELIARQKQGLASRLQN